MTIVAQFSWHDIASTDFGNPARTAWREAVAAIADKAKVTLPECNGRVDSAAKIMLAGAVELLADGKAKNSQTVQWRYKVLRGQWGI